MSPLDQAEAYFSTDDADMHVTGWYALLMWARDLPDWPCGYPKSQGSVFTSHIDQPRSSFKYTPRGSGPVKQEHLGRFVDLQKSAINLNNKGATA